MSKEYTTAEELSFEIYWEKRQRLILLICAGVGLVVGLIIGITKGAVFPGIWFGTGIGGALSYFSDVPYIFKSAIKEAGIWEGIKETLIGIALWVILFAVLGLIGLVVRLLIMTFKIKKFEKQLAALQQPA